MLHSLGCRVSLRGPYIFYVKVQENMREYLQILYIFCPFAIP